MINKFNNLNGKNFFFSGIFQNYLIFTPALKCIKYFHATTGVYSMKSNGMSAENIENITKSDSIFAPSFVDYHVLPDKKFNGHCLVNNNISIAKKVINLYISYMLGSQLRFLNTDFALGNCLFGAVKLNKHANLDKCKYINYGIGFDSRPEFLLPDGSYGKNVIIFGVDMSSSIHVDNKRKDILTFGEKPTQRLDDTTLAAEANYPINLHNQEKDLY